MLQDFQIPGTPISMNLSLNLPCLLFNEFLLFLGVSDSYLESGVSLREAEESDDDQPPDSDTELPLDDTNSKPGFTGSLVHSTPRKSSDSTEGEARQGTTTSSVTQNPFHAAIGIEKHQESSFNQTLARIKPGELKPHVLVFHMYV